MKRIILLLSLLFVGFQVSAHTIGALRIVEGSWVSIKNEDATIYVEFDYSATRWFITNSYEEHCGEDYQARVELSLNEFVAAFNENSQGLKMSTNPEGAKYKLVFHITNLEIWQMSSLYGRLCMFVHGEMEITEITTSATICKIAVKGHSGKEDYTPEGRIAKCFSSLAKRLTKFKK